MAKKTRAAINEELANTLSFDGTVYNINAVNAEHSNVADDANRAAVADRASVADRLGTNAGDENTPVFFKDGVPQACTALDLNTTGNAATATKVNNALNIYEYTTPAGAANMKQFTGELEQAVHVVPATGGSFRGPVTVPTEDASRYTNPELAVLNRGQIETMVNKLTGSPLSTWDGSTLVNQTDSSGSALLKFDTIIGPTASYEALRVSPSRPEAFLYICSDGAYDVYLNAPGCENKRLVVGDTSIAMLVKSIYDVSVSVAGILSGASAANKADTLKVGSDYVDYSYFQKKITVSPNIPSGGSHGDLWIRY